MPDEIKLLSGGSPKTAVVGCIDAFMAADETVISAQFAPAPSIRALMNGDAAGHPDIVVAPVSLVEDFLAEGRAVEGTVARIGDVKAGVAVRRGAAHPDISSEESVRQAILDADRVIYNEASSGAYIRTMIEQLGVAEAIEAKTERFPSAGDVMIRLGAGEGTEIGFGQVMAILRLASEGVELVGPLPGALGHTTSYAAVLTAASRHAEAARRFLDYLKTDAARKILSAAGAE